MTDNGHKLTAVFWETTLRCNAYCMFCGSRCGVNSATADEVPGSLVCKTFDRIAEAYDPAEIMVNITGGEPLLRRDLFEVMTYVHELGFPWGIVTNGVLITDEIVQNMKASGMKTISISIDGLYDVHNKARNLPGGFERIIAEIRKLADADFLDFIEVTTVVTSENVDLLEDMYRFFEHEPIDIWRIALVDPIGRGIDEKDLMLDRESLDKVFAFMDAHQFSSKPRVTTSCSHYLGNRDTLHRVQHFNCTTGRYVASILANGDIFVCPNVPRVKWLIQGNIKQDDFVDVWENGFSWFRDCDIRRVGECAECDRWNECKGDSIHTWDFDTETPKFCIKRNYDVEDKNYELPDEMKSRYRNQTDHLKGLRISYGSSSKKLVYISPEASKEIMNYFHVGQRHPSNLCELMAGLAGYIRDDRLFVEGIIPVHLPARSENQAMFDSSVQSQVKSELQLMNRYLPESDAEFRISGQPWEFIGYIHSHPGELTAQMSQPDMDMHQNMKKLFKNYLTIILNPQKNEICAWMDSPYSPVDMVVMGSDRFVEEAEKQLNMCR